MKVEVAAEALVLAPGRAAYRPRRRQLFIADPHFGKAEAFRAKGVPVPEGTTGDNLQRLDTLIAQFNPACVVYLGDFLHARVEAVFAQLASWRARHAALDMLLVRGNHDARAGALPAALGIREAPEHSEDGLVFRHAPGFSSAGYTLAGHLHPAYRLRGRGRESVRLPCFWIRRTGMVLPAFGSFTGAMEIEREAGDRVCVIAGDRVIDASSQPRLSG